MKSIPLTYLDFTNIERRFKFADLMFDGTIEEAVAELHARGWNVQIAWERSGNVMCHIQTEGELLDHPVPYVMFSVNGQSACECLGRAKAMVLEFESAVEARKMAA